MKIENWQLVRINFAFCVLFYFGASSPYMEQRDRRTDGGTAKTRNEAQ